MDAGVGRLVAQAVEAMARGDHAALRALAARIAAADVAHWGAHGGALQVVQAVCEAGLRTPLQPGLAWQRANRPRLEMLLANGDV